MQIYISGQIIGLCDDEVKLKFQEAEELLSTLGLNPINPLENGVSTTDTWNERMTKGVQLLSPCETILMLDNWRDAQDARIEYDFAIGAGKEVLFEKQLPDSDIMERLISAIHEVTGLTFEDISGKTRRQDTFYSRMIFAYNSKDIDVHSIARLLNRDRTTISKYINSYNDEKQFNPIFRELAEQVEEKINSTASSTSTIEI